MDATMKRIPFHSREMGISIQYHVMLSSKLIDRILQHFATKFWNFTTFQRFLTRIAIFV